MNFHKEGNVKVDIQIGDKVRVLRDGAAVGRDPLKEGEVVMVVARKPAKCGGLALTVCRDGETAQHSAHSANVEIIADAKESEEDEGAGGCRGRYHFVDYDRQTHGAEVPQETRRRHQALL